MLDWKDKYSIGVELIDEQHKHLFEIGNKAVKLLKNDFYIDKYDKIIEIIQELCEYTEFHFKAEEGYMLKIGSKQYESQKIEHDAFIKKINSVDLNKIDNDQQKYLEDLLAFVFNWIIEHILQKDKLIKEN
ncbi:bacteriohemerythrin [Clostridium carboxidivorans P7]|uniref:Hemerythrin-like metal-binding protein n=1 Tax=Clostridium carboxidivorans P7 TaxID=536227 RepID=C6PPV7_9CLOT|nr:hemerythrin family protein [Clostridium carboxidivorans]AKN31120.1 bacteriohemerythrin [Clostridium carboxidivorans P7]EET88698.1 hemerythrin-like metal-binding protein [Clostridium carboxidivorans P7]EFG88609.1 hemerythrin HHE cation binding domain protein [Clostridium carboxidivorans P7]